MIAVILAGGYGTRISEESGIRPKPMVEIGDKPILWHIMKIYSHYGINDFVICCGYKGHIIKEYFSNYYFNTSDLTIDLNSNSIEVLKKQPESWKITLVDTGESTMTGGRIKKVSEYINNETFCLTYGDGVANIDIGALLKFHRSHGKKATLTSVKQPGRFGVFSLEEGETKIDSFMEKPAGDNIGSAWINGGFFVLEPEVLNYIEDDSTIFEKKPLEKLASEGELHAYKHTGFWQPMDTLRDKYVLEELWKNEKASWKIW